MKEITILPLIFLAAFVPIVGGDILRFYIKGEFYCFKKEFRYHLDLHWDDWVVNDYDQWLSNTPPVSSHAVRNQSEGNYVHLYELNGEVDWKLEWKGDYPIQFLMMEVVHNCTTGRSNMWNLLVLDPDTATTGRLNNIVYFNFTTAMNYNLTDQDMQTDMSIVQRDHVAELKWIDDMSSISSEEESIESVSIESNEDD